MEDVELMMYYPNIKEEVKRYGGRTLKEVNLFEPNPDINSEFKYFGQFLGSFLHTLRLSIKDNSILVSAASLPSFLNILAWLTWVVAVFLTNIILLNYLIAESLSAYVFVAYLLDSVICKEKAIMIVECERMVRDKSKTKE